MTPAQLIAAIRAAKPRPDAYGDDTRFVAENAVESFASNLIDELRKLLPPNGGAQ